MIKKKGYWFYGYSGAGKTFASNYFRKKIKNCIIIDGDAVRKYISFDLKYSKKHRDLQITRVYGIAKISIDSNLFPIISTVWMNKMVLKKAKSSGIKVIKINNSKNYHQKLIQKKIKKNIVGHDIFYENFKTFEITNTKNSNFKKLLCKI
jgi:adenylylsulfate kinase-like enzyme